jgi:uncharacterized protein (TIGR02466 family)
MINEQNIKRKIYEPFGFPVGVYDLECDPSINQWLIKTAYALDNFSQENTDIFHKISGAGTGVRTLYNNNNKSFIGAHTWIMNRCHNFPNFPTGFSEKIMKCVYDYAKFIGMSLRSSKNCTLYIERCWPTITKSSDVIKGHNHSQHIFSSVYYPSHTPKQGDLWFDRGDNCNRNVKFESNKGADEKSLLKIQQGQFVIFHSNVFHGTQENKSNEDRISYSFDIDSIGVDYKLPPTKIVQDVWKDFNTTITNSGLMEVLLDES